MQRQTQSLALPIGVSTKPGAYTLEMVVYRQADRRRAVAACDAPSPDGQRLHLGEVTVQPAATHPGTAAAPGVV